MNTLPQRRKHSNEEVKQLRESPVPIDKSKFDHHQQLKEFIH